MVDIIKKIVVLLGVPFAFFAQAVGDWLKQDKYPAILRLEIFAFN
ncbi:MAG: hypothetical protein PG979_001449 [Rickettsia asembonensis]|nr:MAG: hypothetical protein PG979_001449 [Rickettsia asembonensis]